MKSGLEIAAVVINAIATAVMALISFLLWRLSYRQHTTTARASLAVGLAKARFKTANREVRVELLLVSPNLLEAVLKSWTLVIVCGRNEFDISDGQLSRTSLMKAPAYIGSHGWVIGANSPAALSLIKKIPAEINIDSKAVIKGTIVYSGRGTDGAVLEVGPVPVEIS